MVIFKFNIFISFKYEFFKFLISSYKALKIIQFMYLYVLSINSILKDNIKLLILSVLMFIIFLYFFITY